jgi:hypothetical protein
VARGVRRGSYLFRIPSKDADVPVLVRSSDTLQPQRGGAVCTEKPLHVFDVAPSGQLQVSSERVSSSNAARDGYPVASRSVPSGTWVIVLPRPMPMPIAKSRGVKQGRRCTDIHCVQVQDRIPHQLPGPMICHLAPSHGDEEVRADVLHLFLFWVQLVWVWRVVAPAGGICRCVLFWSVSARLFPIQHRAAASSILARLVTLVLTRARVNFWISTPHLSSVPTGQLNPALTPPQSDIQVDIHIPSNNITSSSPPSFLSLLLNLASIISPCSFNPTGYGKGSDRMCARMGGMPALSALREGRPYV